MLKEFGFLLMPLIIKIIMAFIIIFTFYVVSIFLNKIILRFSKKYGNEQYEQVFHLLGRIMKTTTIILGITTAIGTAGVNVSALVASLGLTGFSLGLALKDALSNTLSGVLIIIYQPFKIGDFIKVNNLDGKVIKIDLRYTTLQNDNSITLIPNSNLLSTPVTVGAAR